MPRLNRRGEVVSGPQIQWLDDDHHIAQQKAGEPDTWELKKRVPGGPWELVEKRGANFLSAGGGHWIGDNTRELFGPTNPNPSYGMPAGQDGRGCVATDGTILLARNRQNQGLVLKRADGSERHEPQIHPTDKSCVVDRDRAFGIGGDGLPWVLGLPMPVRLPGQLIWPTVLLIDGRPWLFYHAEDRVGVVLHPFDSFEGYRVATLPAFYPHAVVLDPVTVKFSLGRDAAESSVVTDVHDLRAPRIHDLRTLLGPIVVPDPQPDPKSEPQPEPVTMKIPASVQASIRRFVDTFPVPGGLPPGDAAKEAMRPYMRRIAEQVAFDVGLNYGCKSTGPGSHQSPDALAQPRAGGNGLLWIWDIFSGTGTGNPRLNLDASSEPDEFSRQHFIPVTATDHVGSGSQPGNGGTEPQPGGITKDDLDAALDKLRRVIKADMDDLAGRVKVLEDKPPNTSPLPSNLARKGDSVKVTGKVSLGDVTRSRDITWTGSIQD